jgi:hypothetical protein
MELVEGMIFGVFGTSVIFLIGYLIAKWELRNDKNK